MLVEDHLTLPFVLWYQTYLPLFPTNKKKKVKKKIFEVIFHLCSLLLFFCRPSCISWCYCSCDVQVHSHQMNGKLLIYTWHLSWRRWVPTYKHRKKKCLCDNNVDIWYYVTSHSKVGYVLCSFQRGQPDRTQANSKRDRGQMQISKDDIMYISRSWGHF